MLSLNAAALACRVLRSLGAAMSALTTLPAPTPTPTPSPLPLSLHDQRLAVVQALVGGPRDLACVVMAYARTPQLLLVGGSAPPVPPPAVAGDRKPTAGKAQGAGSGAGAGAGAYTPVRECWLWEPDNGQWRALPPLRTGFERGTIWYADAANTTASGSGSVSGAAGASALPVLVYAGGQARYPDPLAFGPYVTARSDQLHGTEKAWHRWAWTNAATDAATAASAPPAPATATASNALVQGWAPVHIDTALDAHYQCRWQTAQDTEGAIAAHRYDAYRRAAAGLPALPVPVPSAISGLSYPPPHSVACRMGEFAGVVVTGAPWHQLIGFGRALSWDDANSGLLNAEQRHVWSCDVRTALGPPTAPALAGRWADHVWRRWSDALSDVQNGVFGAAFRLREGDAMVVDAECAAAQRRAARTTTATASASSSASPASGAADADECELEAGARAGDTCVLVCGGGAFGSTAAVWVLNLDREQRLAVRMRAQLRAKGWPVPDPHAVRRPPRRVRRTAPAADDADGRDGAASAETRNAMGYDEPRRDSARAVDSDREEDESDGTADRPDDDLDAVPPGRSYRARRFYELFAHGRTPDQWAALDFGAHTHAAAHAPTAPASPRHHSTGPAVVAAAMTVADSAARRRQRQCRTGWSEAPAMPDGARNQRAHYLPATHCVYVAVGQGTPPPADAHDHEDDADATPLPSTPLWVYDVRANAWRAPIRDFYAPYPVRTECSVGAWEGTGLVVVGCTEGIRTYTTTPTAAAPPAAAVSASAPVKTVSAAANAAVATAKPATAAAPSAAVASPAAIATADADADDPFWSAMGMAAAALIDDDETESAAASAAAAKAARGAAHTSIVAAAADEYYRQNPSEQRPRRVQRAGGPNPRQPRVRVSYVDTQRDATAVLVWHALTGEVRELTALPVGGSARRAMAIHAVCLDL